MEIQQAVILVGGRGERLRPLTDSIPKPMMPVCTKPFLEHLVILLRDNGIKRFLFLTGYLGERIKSYFNDGNKWGVNIDYLIEKEPAGTGGALRLAKDKLDDKFFLLFGDSYLPIDYKKMADRFLRANKKMILAVYDNFVNTQVPFNVKLDKTRGVVVAYRKSNDNPESFNYCDAGVIAADKEVVRLIKDAYPISLEKIIYPVLISKEQLGYYVAEDRFYDIGTIERLNLFEKYILGSER
jgi:NDP-sugar pyrophosphorylase family protein